MAGAVSAEESVPESTVLQPPCPGHPGCLQSLVARPMALSNSACPLQLLSWLPHGLLLHRLHGLLHVDDELRGLPALRVHGHRLDALHIIGGHDQVVLLGQLHGRLLEGFLNHDRVVGAGLLIGDL